MQKSNIPAGTTVENKGKLILTEIFPSVQKHVFLVFENMTSKITLLQYIVFLFTF